MMIGFWLSKLIRDLDGLLTAARPGIHAMGMLAAHLVQRMSDSPPRSEPQRHVEFGLCEVPVQKPAVATRHLVELSHERRRRLDPRGDSGRTRGGDGVALVEIRRWSAEVVIHKVLITGLAAAWGPQRMQGCSS